MINIEKNIFGVCALTSGSAGNSIFIKNGGKGVLIDCGLSGKEIERRLEIIGESPENISGIIVTHEHSDHCNSVGIMARRYKIPVFLKEKTYERIKDKLNAAEIIFIEKKINIVGLEFEIFPVSHDAVDPIGLIVKNNDYKIGIATDIGFATGLVINKLSGVDCLFIESNYEDKMLMTSDRPFFVKQRIKSRFGHLSNDAAVKLVDNLDKTKLKFIGLCHISEDHNTYDMAYSKMKDYLIEKKLLDQINVSVCLQTKPGSFFRL